MLNIESTKKLKNIAESLNLSKKMYWIFQNNLAKNELGLAGKKHVEKIIANVANTTKVNQWRSTTFVIDWFKSLPQKDISNFIKLDIIEFYPSISEE